MNPSNGSCVYVVHAIETPFYKIGMTTRIKSRLASFHAAAPFIEFDPVLIYYHEDRTKIEKQLHRRFQEQRIEGTEWFKLDEINFEYLKQDIDVIANALDRQKRANEIYPVTDQQKPIPELSENQEVKSAKHPIALTPEFDILQANLLELHKTKTLREIAEEVYEGKVSHGTIHRCLAGHEPQDNEIRKALGLPIAEIQYRDPITGRYVGKPK